MRCFFLIVLVIFSACSSSRNMSQVDDLVLLEAYSSLSVGGKEAENEMNVIKHYSFVFEQNLDLRFEKVWVYGQAYEFESFEYEGKLFLVVKTFPKNDLNKIIAEMPFSTEAAALIQYDLEKGKIRYLEVEEFAQKEAIIGK